MALQMVEYSAPVEEAPTARRWQPDKGAMVILVAILASHLPLLYWHLAALLAKPHFQFVILLPVGVAALAWQRWQRVPTLVRGSTWIAAMLGVIALGVLATATYFWSPWLASVAAMLTLLAAFYSLGGGVLLRAMLPAWFLLVCFVGVPFDLDVDLIKFLRLLATNWSSALLDEFGIPHLVEGNVIQLPGRAFFVADACSGIHSLFVIAAAALFLGLWNWRPIYHIVVLLICSLALVIIENLTRLVGVVAADRLGLNIADGWSHQVFGGIVFVVTLLLLLSADQFIAFFLPHQLFMWKRNRVLGRDRLGRATTTDSDPTIGPQRLFPAPYIAFVVGFIFIGGWQLARVPAAAPALKQFSLDSAFPELAKLSETDMPPRINHFSRKSLRFEKRSQDDPKGLFSQIWTYDDGVHQVEISADYAYSSVRDLCQCYELTGWTVEHQNMVDANNSAEAFVEASLSKPYRGNALLMFSFLNRAGENGARIYPRDSKSVARRFFDRLTSLVRPNVQQPSDASYEIDGPVFQIQLLATGEREFSDAEREKATHFFRVARDHLRKKCLVKLGGGA